MARLYGKYVNVLLMSVWLWAAGTSAAQATARMGYIAEKLLFFEAGAMYETADFMPYFESL